MLHLVPNFNVYAPNNVWRVGRQTNILPALAMSALLTERADEREQSQPRSGFWGAPAFGSHLHQELISGISASKSTGSFSYDIGALAQSENQRGQIQNLHREISEILEFLKTENLAETIDIAIEAYRGSYRITITIDEHILQF